MPRVSIVITARNVADQLPGCIASLSAQTFGDFEAIVVDDASKDGTSYVAQGATKRDPRFQMLQQPHGKGVHLGRMAGVERASGDYLLFLDGAAELEPTMLEQLVGRMSEAGCDMLRFGADVESTPAGHSTRLQESGIELDLCARDNQSDPAWCVSSHLFSTPLAQRAFATMAAERLDGTQDIYEMTVLACKAHVADAAAGSALPHPHAEDEAAPALTLKQFESLCQSHASCIDACQSWLSTWDGPSAQTCLHAAHQRCATALADAWLTCLPEGAKADGVGLLAHTIGCAASAAQLFRLAGDRMEAALRKGETLDEADRTNDWLTWADGLAAQAGQAADRDARLIRLRRRAQDCLKELGERRGLSRFEGRDIRIFVSTHKPVDTFASNILQPVQVGAAKAAKRFSFCLQDDAGENISHLNAQYCELTTQYWAWKNTDSPYVGFCHYRRYFDFSDTRHEENPFGEVMDGRICAQTQEKYGLTDEAIEAAIEGWDVVTTEVKKLSSFPGRTPTPHKQYAAAPSLHIKDLDRVVAILKEKSPDYAQDADAFLAGPQSCFCNMFVMRRAIFDEYCAWLFPILEEFCRQTDMSRYSREALRTPGHLAERLLNIFLMHAERTGRGWKRKQVQCVHFEHPEPAPRLGQPQVPQPWRPTIPVVFAADDNYVPMLTTTIHSVLANASDAYFYDVVVLQNGITADHQRIMRAFLEASGKASVRFAEAGSLVDKYNLRTNNAHIGIETYFRFLIQELMPWYDKVLYLDSDLVVEGDISQLWQVELGDNLLAAAHDIDFLGNLNAPGSDHASYNERILHMKDPYNYLQAGVLVLNTEQMRQLHPMEEWLKLASNNALIYNDQDVLNAACEGRVTYLDWRWNVMHDCGDRVSKVFSYAPAEAFAAYNASRTEPLVIHYAGLEKPWKYPGCDFAERYWHYARQTPFYELMLAALSGKAGMTAPKIHEKVVDPKNPIRRIVDPICPVGSKRRETLKAIGRKLRGRS